MTTVRALAERAFHWYGTSIAVVDGERSLSFAEVGDRSARLANVLVDAGELGGVVAILLGNRLEYIEVDVAIARAAKVKAPINPKLSDDERRHILANVSAETVVTSRDEADRVLALWPDLPDLRTVISIDGGPGTLDYEQALAAARSRPPDVPLTGDTPSLVLHTSGTTGRPKGATISDAARVAGTLNMLADEFAPGASDGMVHVAPLSHGSGSKVMAYLSRGARQIILPKYDPEEFLDVAVHSGGTSSFMVPTMIRMLLDAVAGREDVPALRNVTYGGSPIDPNTLDEALDRFGPIFVQVYGSCEAPHPVTVLSRSDHVATTYERRRRSAGREATQAEVRVMGDDAQEVATEQPGELWVRGPNLMTGYWNDPGATDEVLVDGWYRTGDVGLRDGRGYIYVMDRKRDMIISGGLNVYPAEVEAVLSRHQAVQQVSVIGVPDPLWGEAVTAFVVPRDGLRDSHVLVEHCRQHLASYKKPRHVRFVTDLPTGSTGKVLKSELRERFGTSVAGDGE